MIKDHQYKSTVQWTGNKGAGTDHYSSYERSHQICIENKPDILGSSDPAFRGDKTKHNPEDLLVSSLSACHMLWYLHLCAQAGVVVIDYIDHAIGIMRETETGGGHFTEVTLNPVVMVLEESMIDLANDLHAKANEHCFIANSVNFPVYHKPKTITV
ncbi:MAG: hypothetical protein RL040_1404 [Bacteroidota bacterium]|jgi:organic hydroperoxide reductase OsmC/OhrA